MRKRFPLKPESPQVSADEVFRVEVESLDPNVERERWKKFARDQPDLARESEAQATFMEGDVSKRKEILDLVSLVAIAITQAQIERHGGKKKFGILKHPLRYLRQR